MKTTKILIGFILFPLIFLSCKEQKGGTTSNTNGTNTNIGTRPALKADSIFDQFAKVICGNYDGVPNNVDSSYYRIYKNQLNQKLTQIKTSRLSPITKWNATNLKRNNIADTTTVFYPFSGGDFIHVNALFPNANNYIMMAQESVGSIPDFKKLDKTQSKDYIEAVDFILRDIYAKSYFITMNMIKDTKESPVNGMLPILLWSVSKTGHTIVKVEDVKVDIKGNKTFLPFKVGLNDSKIVRITFGNNATNQIKTLTYYSCDISNDGIKKDSALARVMQSIPPSNCFIKSASYLLHYTTFSNIRTVILEKANCIIQDDTGIPYAYFDKSKFKIELHGTYEKPIKDFSANLFQQDLAEAYASGEYIGLLPFSLGYHWSSGNQNEMVAIKK